MFFFLTDTAMCKFKKKNVDVMQRVLMLHASPSYQQEFIIYFTLLTFSFPFFFHSFYISMFCHDTQLSWII